MCVMSWFKKTQADEKKQAVSSPKSCETKEKQGDKEPEKDEAREKTAVG